MARVVSYNEHTVAQVVDPPPGAAGSPSAQLVRDFGGLLDSGEHADVVFVVAGHEPVRAHAAVLAARSAHFKSMLSCGMREAASREVAWEVSPAPVPAFRVPCLTHTSPSQEFSVTCLHHLLRYLYTDVVCAPALDLVELYCAADCYGLGALKALCEGRVVRGLAVPTAAELYGRACEWAAASPLKAVALAFVVAHFDAVTKTPGFEALSREAIIEVIRSR